MRDVLAANSGEQTYPRQTAFGEASSRPRSRPPSR